MRFKSVRRRFQKLAPTWFASPVRRIVQTAALLIFLWLVFYVCWPYDARPARAWSGWIPAEFEPVSGRALVATDQSPDESLTRGAVVHVVDESIQPPLERYVGPFTVTWVGERELRLEPARQIAAEHRDWLAFSPGPWTLHSRTPAGWPAHYADNLQAKEWVPAESFLVIDPLVSISTALAARCWIWSLACVVVILAVCVFVPRGFCSYLCPLGTLIDVCDGLVGRRVQRWRVASRGWWVQLKYYLLTAVLLSSLCGVLASGYLAALPVVTRALVFLVQPLQLGPLRGWHQVPPLNAGHAVSFAMFVAILGLGLLQPRFWCKYVCPSGALFSLGNLLRVNQRKVETACIDCGKCVQICPFDAIQPDYATRTADCTYCQTCGGVCPTGAIKFVPRWNDEALKPTDAWADRGRTNGRRQFLSLAAGAVVGGLGYAGLTHVCGAHLADPDSFRPVRPPGSVPEQAFLQMCIRCGLCFQACPNNVLQPLSFQQGLEGLWTPHVRADWSGCESSCNACGQVCPTGAIRALLLAEKRFARLGLAVIDRQTCLPYAGRAACQLCVDDCLAAGYQAIEFTQVGTEVDEQGAPIDGTGYLAPVVLAEKCVGCGLCQTRCYGINVVEQGWLKSSAIVVQAGDGKEDRLQSGSYVALREAEARKRREAQQPGSGNTDDYLPEWPR